MPILTMDEAKAHLRIDGPDEDADTSLKLAAAEDAVIHHLNRPLPWIGDDDQPAPVPASVKVAILLMLGDLYANREAAIVGATHAVNPTVARLLDAYRRIPIA